MRRNLWRLAILPVVLVLLWVGVTTLIFRLGMPDFRGVKRIVIKNSPVGHPFIVDKPEDVQAVVRTLKLQPRQPIGDGDPCEGIVTFEKVDGSLEAYFSKHEFSVHEGSRIRVYGMPPECYRLLLKFVGRSEPL